VRARDGVAAILPQMVAGEPRIKNDQGSSQ